MTAEASLAHPQRDESWMRRLFALGALGEVLTGIVALAFPASLITLLLDAPPESSAIFLARLLGVAVLALGITWWLARTGAGGSCRLSERGFVIYNLGAGLLCFIHLATVNSDALMLWPVAILHTALAVAMVAAGYRARKHV